MMTNTTELTLFPSTNLVFPYTHRKPASSVKFPTTTATFTTGKRNHTRIAATPSPPTTFSGLCYVVGDNIDTDQIIPAIHCTLNPLDLEDYKQLGAYALIGLPHAHHSPFVQPNQFTSKYSIIIAGENFGCGSSRELAPKCLEAAGVIAVVGESFARIFFRNCVSTGELYPLESEVRIYDEFKTGDEAVINVNQNLLINCSTGKEFKLKALGDAMPIIQAGGIFAYARKTSMISQN